ncbi:malonic semialdehyde reductase [Chelativorans salis]|uniref:Malonic semialdehyde reductase n=1 Tax=Chelativorans salis TaxID=2978478 RepID=A0ABT2LUD5_9HYPH|nr:malonic semialdehyde reductase [Chelativorans sp. EGI FJ00035]MCT7378129.1 malonic semialdehyde reductase [Chelativorans sp. EGI FJ00035]
MAPTAHKERTRMDDLPAADPAVLDALFLEAHTCYKFSDREVPDDLLGRIYDVARVGPTSSNGSPMRVIFVKSAEGKARLMPGVRPNNVPKVESAPVTAVFGIDQEFYEHFDRLAPHAIDRIANYRKDKDLAQRASFRNATLQAAYFLVMARAHGLSCGPMSGFLHDVVDDTFFEGGHRVKSNFLMNIGYPAEGAFRPRGYRFGFDEVCEII